MNKLAQHLATAFKIFSSPEIPKNVEFCPAAEVSSESSPTALDLTANLEFSSFFNVVCSWRLIWFETVSTTTVDDIKSTALKKFYGKVRHFVWITNFLIKYLNNSKIYTSQASCSKFFEAALLETFSICSIALASSSFDLNCNSNAKLVTQNPCGTINCTNEVNQVKIIFQLQINKKFFNSLICLESTSTGQVTILCHQQFFHFGISSRQREGHKRPIPSESPVRPIVERTGRPVHYSFFQMSNTTGQFQRLTIKIKKQLIIVRSKHDHLL